MAESLHYSKDSLPFKGRAGWGSSSAFTLHSSPFTPLHPSLFTSKMNLLAHAFLAQDDPNLLLGSLMGDFVKGPLNDRYAPAITRGLILHRSVDTYTDAHPLVARSRARISRVRRRYAGILIDVFYDHYLARDWSKYSS